LADISNDPSRSAAKRAYNFMGNGGGTVTFRVVVPVLLAMLGALVGGMWSDLKDGQREVVRTVTDQGKGIATNSTRLDMIQAGQQHLWVQLGKDEQRADDTRDRVTRLESCQPVCKPR
jgi:hypothetical protein